ncbi:glycosyl hydrolase family 28-related protein [Mucilaginibacter antarcticus]|uniref:Glycosyl hydrolase family 28-related protein n=1 Tax=Mucilaginibacter antarcticus TaxID=1855725 RepID=A0ABW5XJG0_9SPHI
MKRLLTAAVVLLAFSCKKENTLQPQNTPTIQISNSTASFNTTITTPIVNVQSCGAKGDGITDDTQAIVKAITQAKANKVPTVYFPDGTYLIKTAGNNSGVIALANGVGLQGNSPATCHIKLSTGRHNPTSLFYQAWWDEPTVSDIVIQGIDFDGASFGQTYDASYEYGHALSINNGQNIEVRDCKFQNLRGDGLLFGDTFLSSINQRITYNVNVHDSEFYNIYREGVMFCCTNGGSFYNNNVHGNGYFVAGVDIERHSLNETVQNISVYNNIFNFTDGYGPIERGGPAVRYRRAVAMGFFYAGYTAGVDVRSGSHKIYGNKIYQGQIDCFGHINVNISDNTFTNTYENITGVSMITAPAINVADPDGNTSGLLNVDVVSNVINSSMPGNGIAFNHYKNVTAKANTITGTQADGISILNTTGMVVSNTITNVGTTTKKASGIVINGTTPGLYVGFNKVADTKTGTNRTVNYAVQIQSENGGDSKPHIENNKGVNLLMGIVSEYYYQLGFAIVADNTAG